MEIGFAEPHQSPVGCHCDRGVAFCLGDQGFFTEAITGPEFRQLDSLFVQRRFAGHHAFAGDHHVEKISLGALLDDDIFCPIVDALHAHEYGLDIRGRNAMKCLGLQQRGHPIAGHVQSVAAQFSHFVLAGLIPGQQHVEQITVDHDVFKIHSRACREFPRQPRGQRRPGFRTARTNRADYFVIGTQLDLPRNQVEGALVGIALFEQYPPGA